jgi:hypothetical protein
MATAKTIEVPVRAVLDDEDRRRVRAVANALTKASGAVAELAEAFAALADGGRVLDDDRKPEVGDTVEVIEGNHDYGVTEEFVGKTGRVTAVVGKYYPGGLEHIQVKIDGTGGAPLGGWYMDYKDVKVVRRA